MLMKIEQTLSKLGDEFEYFRIRGYSLNFKI
jgi:hypothetical protein